MTDKTLENTTGSAILIDDTGVYIETATTYTIPPTDYGLWAASVDIVTEVNSGDIVVGNGTNDLPAVLGLAHLKQRIYEGAGSPSIVTGITCDSGVIAGDAVRMSGGTAVKAQANSFSNSQVIGVVESKFNSTTCDIRLSGVGGEIFAGLDVSKPYFLSSSTAGALTTTPPTGSGNYVYRIGIPLTDKRLVIDKGLRMGRS